MTNTLSQNFSPYYNDYDPEKCFSQVLFKPGVQLQARELTQLQSILQEQIAHLAQFSLPPGASTDGAITTVVNTVYYKFVDTVSGVLINFEDLIDTQFTFGTMQGVILDASSDGYLYFADGTVFEAGDEISTLFGTLTVSPPADFDTGSNVLVCVAEGLYYTGERIVPFKGGCITPTKLNTNLNGTVCFECVTSIVTPKDDASLNNPAKGTYGYRGEGADRLKIEMELVWKENPEDDDVCLVQFEDGEETVISNESPGNVTYIPYLSTDLFGVVPLTPPPYMWIDDSVTPNCLMVWDKETETFIPFGGLDAKRIWEQVWSAIKNMAGPCGTGPAPDIGPYLEVTAAGDTVVNFYINSETVTPITGFEYCCDNGDEWSFDGTSWSMGEEVVVPVSDRICIEAVRQGNPLSINTFTVPPEAEFATAVVTMAGSSGTVNGSTSVFIPVIPGDTYELDVDPSNALFAEITGPNGFVIRRGPGSNTKVFASHPVVTLEYRVEIYQNIVNSNFSNGTESTGARQETENARTSRAQMTFYKTCPS